MPSRSPATMAAIEGRRDRVVDMYVRLRMSEREIASRLRELGIPGGSPTTVHFDLVARGVALRSQTSGLNRGIKTPEHLEKLQDGNRQYRVDVERAKAERGLLGIDEILRRMARAGVPRSPEAIRGYVAAGLVEPESDLGFAKPWLFTEASADALIARLTTPPRFSVRGYRDGRMTRFNATTEARVRFRATWYLARHKSSAWFGPLSRLSERSLATRRLESGVARLWLSQALTHEAIGKELGISDRYVRIIAQRLGLPRRSPGRRPQN